MNSNTSDGFERENRLVGNLIVSVQSSQSLTNEEVIPGTFINVYFAH